jgi:hypothetical protein
MNRMRVGRDRWARQTEKTAGPAVRPYQFMFRGQVRKEQAVAYAR